MSLFLFLQIPRSGTRAVSRDGFLFFPGFSTFVKKPSDDQRGIVDIVLDLAKGFGANKVRVRNSIVDKGLKYGFSIEYGEKWIGNPQIREALRNVGIECHQPAHKVLCEKVLEFLEQEQDIENKQRWFYHDMRILLQNLLANGCCIDEKAEQLGKRLDQINEISHKYQEM